MKKDDVKALALSLGLSGEVVATNTIKANPNNPRVLRDEKFALLKRSIEEFPKMLALRPIVTDADGVVLGGNMRLRALQDLGYNWLPAEWVRRADTLTEDERRQFVIKDNASFGEWDWDALANDWDDDDLRLWGVDVWDGNVGLDTQGGEEPVLAEEDGFDELEEEIETICKYGDIYQLGEHRLMCGDSTNAESVAKLMGGEVADLFLTDPPYNCDVTGGTNEHLKIKNDNMADDKFQQFLNDAFKAADAVMKNGCPFYLWHASKTRAAFGNAIDAQNWNSTQYLIWNKNSLVLSRSDYQWKHEPCFYGWKKGTHYFFDSRRETTVIQDGREIDPTKMKKDELVALVKEIFSARTATDVIDCDRPSRSEVHPTMKPVKLFAYLMRNSSRRGENVLDLFGGSGTTIVAAEQQGRRAFVMELDPHYCDVIIARWEKLTGKKAVKVS